MYFCYLYKLFHGKWERGSKKESSTVLTLLTIMGANTSVTKWVITMADIQNKFERTSE